VGRVFGGLGATLGRALIFWGWEIPELIGSLELGKTSNYMGGCSSHVTDYWKVSIGHV